MGTKRWPGDAVMIVASPAGEAVAANMQAVVECRCRDCGGAVHADSDTIRRCAEMPGRGGRPIRFVCIPCAVRYDVNSLDLLVDHRKGGPSQ